MTNKQHFAFNLHVTKTLGKAAIYLAKALILLYTYGRSIKGKRNVAKDSVKRASLVVLF